MKLIIEVNTNAKEDIQDLRKLTEFLSGDTPEKPSKPEKVSKSKKEEKKSSKKAEKKAEKKNEEPEEDEGITINQVRTAVSDKVNDYRSEIKEKLTEMGASNVTSLDESKYEEFLEFLSELD